MKFAGPVIIICAIVAFLFVADYWMNSGKVYRGVEVGGVSLGGLTESEARREIQERSTGALGAILVLNPTGGDDFTFDPQDVGIDYDVDATLDRAYAVGREGGFGERISDRLQSAYGTVEIEPEYSYDSARAEQRVADISSTLDAPERDASVEVVGSAVEVGESANGYATDRAATLEAINASVEDMSGEAEVRGAVLRPNLTTEEAERAASRVRSAMDGQLSLSGGNENWNISPAAIGSSLVVSEQNGDFHVSFDRQAMRQNLQPVYATLQQPAIEADYEVSGTNVSVTPSQQGQTIQTERLLSDIESGIFEGRREFEIPLTVDRPEMTTEQAEAMKPTEILGEYSTNYLTYDDTPGRITNLQIGSGAVDGQLIAPGEVFSFNALASQYEYESGSVIVNGQVDEADGGGLCQVSSTLYMAANYAGLDVLERHPHFAELAYIQPGFDATVWFGALDMRFQNNTDGYILIKETVDTQSGEVYSAIYGVPQDVEVEMTSEKVDEYSNPEGQPTTEWITYQTVTRDGRVEYDGVLHEDTYDYLQPADS